MLDGESKHSIPDGLSRIPRRILKALIAHPKGLDIFQLRELCAQGEIQDQFDRRLRELDPYFLIKRVRVGRRTIYKLIGPRPPGEWDYEVIPKDLAAKVRHGAHGRCQMCGRTIVEDQIKLQIDHKIPRSWGGKTVSENLWAICSSCNEGKKNYFVTFDQETMKYVLSENSVHTRILRLLELKHNEWVERDLIEFVANFEDIQEDWKKRLRELRYFGLAIESSRKKIGNRTISIYRLVNWVDSLPDDLTQATREYERKRAQKNVSSPD